MDNNEQVRRLELAIASLFYYFRDERFLAERQIGLWQKNTSPGFEDDIQDKIKVWEGYYAGVQTMYDYFERFIGEGYLKDICERYKE